MKREERMRRAIARQAYSRLAPPAPLLPLLPPILPLLHLLPRSSCKVTLHRCPPSFMRSYSTGIYLSSHYSLSYTYPPINILSHSSTHPLTLSHLLTSALHLHRSSPPVHIMITAVQKLIIYLIYLNTLIFK